MTSDSPRLRFAIVGIVTFSLFAALFARLWFLQVMTAPEYRVAAENNRVRIVREEAPRGRILDRNGNELVTNRRSIVVSIDWQAYDKLGQPEQTSLLTRLARVLTRDAQQRALGLVSGNPDAVPATTAPSGTAAPGTTGTTGTTTSTTSTLPGGMPGTDTRSFQPVTVRSLRARLNDRRFSHFKPVPVVRDVSEQLEIYLVEHADTYPTVSAERVTVRDYPYGQLLAHVLGYVGAVNEADLKDFQSEAKPYELDDEIGKSGVERELERQLRGTPGEIRYEVDARNKPVRRIGGGRRSVPGNDVYLSIDINLQYLAEKSLAAQLAQYKTESCDVTGCRKVSRSGSVVLEDPRNGQLLAMASYPTFDPKVFVGGISSSDYQALTAEGNQEPLVNKAIAGTYAPGSTWKLFTAYSGLANGQITPDTVVDDQGVYTIKGCTGACERKNAGNVRHGSVNLSRAITVSSDVYFYTIGDDIWRRRGVVGDDALAKTYRQWGFGDTTGVGLAGEVKGRVASPAEKRALAKALYGDNQQKVEQYGTWFAGDNVNTAIGQGDVLVTPLQLVNGYSTFANGGTLYRPQLVLQVTRPFSASMVDAFKPAAKRRIPLPPVWRDPMLAGFSGVTQDTASGTAGATFAGFPQDTLPVAGKTGTAQVNGKDDTSLFAAFAPANDPRFAAAAILPEGGYGGSAAAPLIRRILEPVALAGGDLKNLPKAPLGGAFDVAAAVAEILAPPTGKAD